MSKRNGTRRAWTSEQVRTLKTLARKKTPAGKIARALKRTEGATRQKLLASDCLWNRAFKIKLARPNTGLFLLWPNFSHTRTRRSRSIFHGSFDLGARKLAGGK